MRFNPLDLIPLEVSKIQTMDKQSKEYKNAIQDLRLRYLGYIYDMIKHSKTDEFSYIFRYRYRKFLFSTITFLVLAVITLIVAIVSIGEHEISEFTKIETIKFIIFVSTEALTFTIAMFFALKARKVMDDCTEGLIERTKIRCSHFSEKLLSDVSSAYSYTMDNSDIMDDKEKCGCINCLKIFYTDEINNHKFDSATCPFCNTESIIGESSGYPITNDFLTAMKEYWIDS